MIIGLKTNLFTNFSNLQDVNQLLGVFSDRGRYDYFCEYTEIKDTPLYQNLLSIDRDLIKEYFNRIITQEGPIIKYSVSEYTSDTEFNILEAKRFFNQPLTIILENSLNDGYFVNSLLSVFLDESVEINRHKENGWFEYGNAGGCGNVKNFIESRKINFRMLPKEEYRYLRLYVLIDSDKKYPNDKSATRVNLEQYLIENKVLFHILDKREIENYLPDEIIETILGYNAYINAYKSLTPIQKDYFDIEKGFKNKNRGDLDESVKSLYESVSVGNYKILKKGMNYKDIKAEIPKLFGKVTKEQIIKTISHQKDPKELENILKNITELL